MNVISRLTILTVCVALVLCAIPSVFATTASSPSSFEGREEPTAIYKASSKSCSSDSDTNITGSGGTLKFFLRYSSSSWTDDGGGCKGDRQRAEVKGLGSHQKTGETYEYTENWKTNRGGNGKFWHVFQLKATNGDTGTPLVVNSITGGSSAAVRYCSNGQSGFTVARSYSFSTGSFTKTVIRIKPATSGGLVQAGINGGSLSGKTNIALYRSGSSDYRPKWGSYRGVTSSAGYGNDTIEMNGVTANKK